MERRRMAAEEAAGDMDDPEIAAKESSVEVRLIRFLRCLKKLSIFFLQWCNVMFWVRRYPVEMLKCNVM